MSMLNDIRLAFRLFRRTPVPTAIALLSITLSVGATAIVFTAIKAVLIDPLPYARAGELVLLHAGEFAPQLDELSRSSVRQRIYQHRFDRGEDNRSCAHAQRDRQQRNSGWNRSAPKEPERQPDVVQH